MPLPPDTLSRFNPPSCVIDPADIQSSVETIVNLVLLSDLLCFAVGVSFAPVVFAVFDACLDAYRLWRIRRAS